MRHTWKVASAVCACVLTAVASAGAIGVGKLGEATDRVSARATIQLAQARLDVVTGEPVLAPVVVKGEPRRLRSKAFATKLDDGRHVQAELLWIGAASASDAHADTWLAPASDWRVTPWSRQSRQAEAGAGFWALLLHIPAEPRAKWISVGGRRTPLNWLELPQAGQPLRSQRAERDESFAEQGGLEAFSKRLEPAIRDPSRRWRVGLLSARLDEAAAALKSTLETPFEEPALEALAAQLQRRWRAGLDRLAGIDTDLAQRVKLRLTALVDLPWMGAAPVWPTDTVSLEKLLDSLLDPHLDDDALNLRASTWLQEQPHAAFWIIDDAGQSLAGGKRTVVLMGAVNLTDQPELAWLGRRDGRDGPKAPVPPWTAARVVVTAQSDSVASVVSAHLGAMSASVAALTGAASALPPGLTMGPFFSRWTMASWLSASPLRSSGDHATAALLQRSASGEGWELYLEARTAGEPPSRDDSIHIWLGPTSTPLMHLEIRSDGVAINHTADRDRERIIETHNESDRWWVIVPIQRDALKQDGILRIGLSRSDHGRLSSWPRPMLPDQHEPGRAAIDLTAWRDPTPIKP